MSKLKIIFVFSLIGISIPLSDFSYSQVKSEIEINVTGAYTKKYRFSKDVVFNQIVAQPQLPPQATFGFLTDRNSSFPFYFSCVIINIADMKITEGKYSIIEMIDDIPQFAPNNPKSGFLTLTINDNKPQKREFVSIVGDKNYITIDNIKDNMVIGSFYSELESTSELGKRIIVNGKFKIYTK